MSNSVIVTLIAIRNIWLCPHNSIKTSHVIDDFVTISGNP